MFESPIHGIEKIFIKRAGTQQVPQKRLSSKNDKSTNVNNNNSSRTSSESAESVETAWLLTTQHFLISHEKADTGKV